MGEDWGSFLASHGHSQKKWLPKIKKKKNPSNWKVNDYIRLMRRNIGRVLIKESVHVSI